MKNLNFKILLDSRKSKRSKDENGYLYIKDNPIAFCGVYDYLMSEISDIKSDELVKVCREFSDLERKKDLFKDKPILWEHKWTGEQGENQSVDGAIIGDIEAKENGLFADLVIYNSDLIKAIEKGEFYELSPGYEAEILQESGSYNGEHYDYKQILQNVNHLAVVEKGRTGHDLRIQDKGFEKMEKKFTLKAIFDALKKITDDEVVAEVEEVKDDKVTAIFELMKSDLSNDEKKQKLVEILNSENVADENACDDVAEREVEAEKPTAEGEVVAEVSADDVIRLIEKLTDSKIQKAMSDYKATSKALSDSIDEVKAVVKDFDTSNVKSTSEVYALGYEILTGAKLADGLDSKTAFKMEVAKRRPAVIEDKKELSAIEKIANRFN